MQKRIEDSSSARTPDDMPQFDLMPAESKPVPARRKRSSPKSAGPAEEAMKRPSAIEGGEPEEPEETLPDKPAAGWGQVMGGMSIRELEMIPKLRELEQLEEIPVGGTTNIEADVIGAIAGVSAQSVQGVAALGTTSLRRTVRERLGSAERRARGVEVEVGRREAILDISVRVIYGYSIPKTVVEVRYVVADSLLKLCGLVAKEINVRVTGIEFPTKMLGRVE